MRALLVQQGLSAAIDIGSMTRLKQSDEAKARKIEAKAYSAILSHGDDVLREFSSDTEALAV